MAKNTLWDADRDWYLRQYSSSISDSKSSKTTGEVTSSEELVLHEAAEGETGGEVEEEVVTVGSMAEATVACCNLVGLNGSTSQGTSQVHWLKTYVWILKRSLRVERSETPTPYVMSYFSARLAKHLRLVAQYLKITEKVSFHSESKVYILKGQKFL